MAMALLQLSLVHSLWLIGGLSGLLLIPLWAHMVVLSLTGLLVSAIANILWHKQKLPI